MPTLIIMCGLPYSGKTTLAKELAAQGRFALVAYDSLWQEVARDLGKSPEGDLVLKMADEKVAAKLKNGITTVYDTLHYVRDWRDRVVSIAEACGARHMIVYLNSPHETIMERYRANAQSGARHQIKLDILLAEIDKKIEPPQLPEKFVEFLPHCNLKAWVSEFLIHNDLSANRGERQT